MGIRYRPGLRGRLIQLVLLALLPAVGLMLYGAADQRRRAIVTAEHESLRLVRVVSKSHQNLIDSTRYVLMALSRLPDVRRRDPRLCSSLFGDLLKEYPPYANLAVANLNGDVFCSALPIAQPINISDKSYFKEVLGKKDFAIGDYQIGLVSRKAVLVLAYPVYANEDSLAGVILASVDLAWFNRIAVAANLPEHSALTVYDRHGTVLARYPGSEQWVGRTLSDSNIVQTVLGKGDGVAEAVGLDGTARLYGFTSIGGPSHKHDIYLSIGISRAAALADANRELTRNLITLGVVSLLALLAAWYGTDKLVLSQLNALVRTAELIGSGNLGARTGLPHHKNEIGLLAASFDKMARTLETWRDELASANQRIHKNLERTKILHEIDVALASTLDLRTMLNLLLEKIDFIVPGAITTIRLFNKESNKLEPVACWNIDEEAWRAGNPEILHGFTKIVLENRIPLTVTNVQTDPRNEGRQFASRFGLVSYLGVPLVAKNELLGIIAFYTKEEHSFDDEEIEFLMGLANQTAVAIFNAKLYAETSRTAEELSAVHSLTMAVTQSLNLNLVLKEAIKKIVSIFHFDAARIYLYTEEMDELHVKAAFEVKPELCAQVKVYKRGQGIIGRVAETGQPLIFESIDHDPRYAELSHSKSSDNAHTQFLGVFPIATKRKSWGALVCVGIAPRKLNVDDLSLLTSMKNQIGIAVENATLYQDTAKKAKELSALYSIAGVAGESLDLKVVLHKTMEKVLQIYGFDAARIYLRDDETKTAQLVAHEGMGNISCVSNYRIGEGRVGRVMETGEPLYVENMQTDLAYQKTATNRIMLKAGFRGSFIIPIKVRGEILGVMNFLCRKAHHFTQDEIQLIHTIAHHLGMFVGNAQLFSHIRQKTVELEKANKAKDEFLSVMSHELRTPLNVIGGYAQLLQDEMLGQINPQQEGAVKNIMRQSGDLLAMINSVLQVTRIEANVVRVETAEVNLFNFFDDLRSTYAVYVDGPLKIRWDFASDVPVVITDEEKLKHILQNLINNSIKFTDKGQITISTRYIPEDDSIAFTVADTGIGISTESLPVIFEKFRQLDSSDTRNHGGVGIGLYIVKQFTDLLGGTVNVATEVGIGSTFTVTIPRVLESQKGINGKAFATVSGNLGTVGRSL